MPTYEYECNACGHRFERRQRIDDQPIRTCPTCNGPTRRVLYPAGIIFKGSGWYVTDSRKGANGSSGDDGKSAETKSEKADKSEAKKPDGAAT